MIDIPPHELDATVAVPGQEILCIVKDPLGSLTKGKRYLIQSMAPQDDPRYSLIQVLNDNGTLDYYYAMRFGPTDTSVIAPHDPEHQSGLVADVLSILSQPTAHHAQ